MSGKLTAAELYEAIRREHEAAGPDRRPIDDRLTDLGGGTLLCVRRGQKVTHEDLDAVFLFAEFVARAKRARMVQRDG